MVYAFLQICLKNLDLQTQLCGQLFENMDKKSRERGRSLPALKRKTGSGKNEYEFEKLREREQQFGSQQFGSSSEQPTYQEEFFKRYQNLKENVRSEEFEAEFIQEECRQLKNLYEVVKNNLRETINIQQELNVAQEELVKALKKMGSAYQEFQKALNTSDFNKEDFQIALQKSKLIYDACKLTVKQLDSKLETLNKEAKRKKFCFLRKLQSNLKQIEGLQNFHVNIEKAVQRRAQLLAQLKALRQERRQLQDHHKRINQNLHSAKEHRLSKEVIYELRTASIESEEKLKNIGYKIKDTQENITNL